MSIRSSRVTLSLSLSLLISISFSLSLFLSLFQRPAAAAAVDIVDGAYTNPVIRVGSADPHVIKADDGRYYMYNTFGFAIDSSDDLVNWRRAGSAMPVRSWGVADFWAPAVIEHEGRFYLYYSAERREGGKRIGVAVSDRPTGPFRDLGEPLFDPGFPVIDAHPFVDDDGRAYLFFSQDQVSQGPGRHESRLYGIEMGPDLVSVVGEPVLLAKPEQAWERRSGGRLWNEAPFIFKHDGIYYLMYSANCFCGWNYSVGYATSHHPLGPYTKYPGNPILSRGGWFGQISGPGHHSIVESPDGRELWIVYHIHADPATGGGDRRIAIDRMGVREDGSLFVSGPTLTPQPPPSGAGGLVNLAPFAKVAVSSVKDGRTATALVDGEFAIDPAKETWEWVAAGEREGAWIRLEWSKEQRARWIYLYPSVMATRKAASITIRTSDGREIPGVRLPSEPGAAAIVEIGDERSFTWLEVSVDEMAGGGEAGMAEIVVLGYPGGLPGDTLGSVWISSPRRGELLHGSTPLRIQAHHVDPASVLVELDGEAIYKGTGLPEALVIKASELLPGMHRVTATILDDEGREHRYTSEFRVEHARMIEPLAGDRLRGDVALLAEALIPAEEIAEVRVDWVPIGETAAIAQVETVYHGAEAPPRLSLDTLAIPDGAYDLAYQIVTDSGVVSTLTRRVVVDNWEILDDPILPPTESSWFGSIPQIKAVEASSGWAYATNDPGAYFGDANRIYPTSDSLEHLVWRLPQMVDFAVTLYATDMSLLDAIELSASSDGESWTRLSYEVWANAGETDGGAQAALGEIGSGKVSPGEGVLALDLTGSIPPELHGSFFRIAIAPGAVPPGELQIGHVRLRGVPGDR